MNLDNFNLEELNNLSKEEREAVLKILKEYSLDGSSKYLNELKYADYKEVPVDIETFLTDDRYMGIAWKDAMGNSKVYPFWMEQLKKLFPNNLDTNYTVLLETGSRGIGKSEIACAAVAPYMMYRLMCMKNPQEHFNLKSSDSIFFAFMNIDLKAAKKIAVTKFQKNIQMSPWFMARGKMTTFENNPYWIPPEPIEIIIGSQSSHTVGKAVYFIFVDEINFIRNQDIDVQKEKAKDIIDTAVAGTKTRFIYQGKTYGLLAVGSSKRSEQSFMEEYVQLVAQTEGENALIIDKPIWEVKPKETYCGKKFLVAVGNKYLDSLIVPEQDYENIGAYKSKGYQIIEVPIELLSEFKKDIERSLCDYAGISSVNANKYFNAAIVEDCIVSEYKNPFIKDVIEVGNDKKDLTQYKDFFDMNNVPKELMHKPLFVHMDMSTTGDMTGIAGVWIIGKKASGDETPSKDLAFRLAFSVSVKAPKGKQISYEKNRKFIRWLKEVGFNIKQISTDSFQSTDTLQQLASEGYKTKVISVDRVDKTEKHPICRPYAYFKSAVYEHRFEMYKSERLFDEFTNVERNNNTGKIDHTRNYHKDVLDACCGATYSATDFAEQFAYEFGESLETIINVNNADPNQFKQQVIVDLENELKRVMGAGYLNEEGKDNGLLMPKVPDKKQQATVDFMNIANGIMVW